MHIMEIKGAAVYIINSNITNPHCFTELWGGSVKLEGLFFITVPYQM
jgi:hypothetical protein